MLSSKPTSNTKLCSTAAMESLREIKLHEELEMKLSTTCYMLVSISAVTRLHLTNDFLTKIFGVVCWEQKQLVQKNLAT